MNKLKLHAAMMLSAACALAGLGGCGSRSLEETSLEKSQYGNPVSAYASGAPSGPVDSGAPSGPVDSGAPSGPVDSSAPSGPVDSGAPSGPVDSGAPSGLIYGGDPSALVDGDTVYLYTGHDASTDQEVDSRIYNIPEYLCYSTKDMVSWQYEGVVMTMDTVSWAKDDVSAWAAQVAKHYDASAGMDKYYLYFCTWDKTGKQSIGVAVSESPTGPFEDIGEPLVRGAVTKPPVSTFEDIDPTVWVETDETGVERRYLAWGNSHFYMCELNEDMISVRDLDGDGEITCGKKYGDGDIINRLKGLEEFTEAPWLYRRQDENGNYYGQYYLFYAHGWHESMAYAVTDDLLQGTWTNPTVIMQPASTSNTNHMAVIDFKGKTYFIYHNGALPGGNGYRRSPSVVELTFADDGSIAQLEESAAGVGGSTVQIALESGEILSHETYVNSQADADYPYTNVRVGALLGKEEADGLWVLCAGKADREKDSYVSIQSENKQGLYLTVCDGGVVTLAQDTDASEDTAKSQTFRSLSVGDGGICLESVSQPGRYLGVKDGVLCLVDTPEAFSIQ